MDLPSVSPKFYNGRDKIAENIAFPGLSLIDGSTWSSLIKVGPGEGYVHWYCNKTEHQLWQGLVPIPKVL